MQRRIGHHRRQPILVGGGLDQLGIAAGKLVDQLVEHAPTHASGAAEVVVDHQYAHFQGFVGSSNHQPASIVLLRKRSRTAHTLAPSNRAGVSALKPGNWCMPACPTMRQVGKHRVTWINSLVSIAGRANFLTEQTTGHDESPCWSGTVPLREKVKGPETTKPREAGLGFAEGRFKRRCRRRPCKRPHPAACPARWHRSA